jgi:membrane-bound ClpP family serine protease
MAGHLSLASSVASIFIALIVLLKGQTWKRVALEDKLQGKSLESMQDVLKVGERGRTISRLNPVGKALFEEHLVEVSTTGDFVDEDVDVEITKVESNRIKVKPV